MNETWAVIPEFPNYAVSNLGRVKRTPRKYATEHFLAFNRTRDGYFRTALFHTSNGKRRSYYPYIHVLVARAFLGPKPKGLQIDHIDQNKQNNNAGNLRYVTNSVNQANTRRPRTSNFNGVHSSKHAGRWISACTNKGVKYYLGTFSSEIDAARAFDAFVISRGLGHKRNFSAFAE